MTDNQSASIAKLLPALIRARGEFPTLVKDSENPHFRSKYADLAAVVEACDGPLGKHDLAILQVPHWSDGALTLITTLCHTSGEWLRATYPVAADVNRPQVTGAGMTYARRYCYMAIAGIAPEDDDGETATARGQNGHATQAAPTRPINPVAARNLASHENRGGPVARNQPREAPAGFGNGNGHANGNGHTAPAREIGERVPTSGKGLWRWAAEIERLQGPGLIKHMTERAKGRPGWPDKIVNWSAAQVAEAFEDAEAALELIYDPHADAGDDYDDAEHDRDYN
jgi:hypothetical protein